jgi:hypothetical protein
MLMEREDNFLQMVRDRQPITLEQAKGNARNMNNRSIGCGCFSVQRPSNAECCTGNKCCYTMTVPCICCIAYAPCMCVCSDEDNTPGLYTCTDLKGVKYDLMKVDEEKGTLACWNYHPLTSQKAGDQHEVSCYCI